MKFSGIVTLVVCILITSCSKKEEVKKVPEEEEVVVEYEINGTVTSPSGTPLDGVLVTFDNRIVSKEIRTNTAGQYSFMEKGNRSVDLYFEGKPFRYLDMRDIAVDFGDQDRTFDKMMVPWEIEEIDFLTTSFIDNAEKTYSLVQYNFDEVKMEPTDFKNLVGSIHLDKYETTFTLPQSAEEEADVTVSFYSMPKDAGYSIDNHEEVTYSDVLTWKKILTISTTTAPIGELLPVTVNLAAAYADHADYDHSGTIVMVSEEIAATFGVTSDVDLLEIRLPYGNDYVPQN